MEKKTDSFPGTRKANLKRLFKLSVHSLLTSCSKEQFSAAFSRFSGTEQMQLHSVFIRDGFESFCLKTQVDDSLDAVEQLIEEFNMDPLFSERSNLEQIGEDLLAKKKNEIQHLKDLIEKAEEQKHLIKARVERLKEEADGPPTKA